MMRKLFKFVMALCLATFASWCVGLDGHDRFHRRHCRMAQPSPAKSAHFSRFLDSYHFFGFVSLSAEGSRTLN